jgi:hypothetical protein
MLKARLHEGIIHGKGPTDFIRDLIHKIRQTKRSGGLLLVRRNL